LHRQHHLVMDGFLPNTKRTPKPRTSTVVSPPSASHAIRNGERTPFGTWKIPRAANAPNGANYKTMAMDMTLPELPPSSTRGSSTVRLSMTTNNRSYTDYTVEPEAGNPSNTNTSTSTSSTTTLPSLRGSTHSIQQQRRGKYKTTHFPSRNTHHKVPSVSAADSCWRVLGVRPSFNERSARADNIAVENIPRARAYAGKVDGVNQSLWPRLRSYHSPGVTTTSNSEYW